MFIPKIGETIQFDKRFSDGLELNHQLEKHKLQNFWAKSFSPNFPNFLPFQKPSQKRCPFFPPLVDNFPGFSRWKFILIPLGLTPHPRDANLGCVWAIYNDLSPPKRSPQMVVKSKGSLPQNGRKIQVKDLFHKLPRMMFFGRIFVGGA